MSDTPQTLSLQGKGPESSINGRRRRSSWFLLWLVLGPLCCSGLALLAYVVFPPPQLDILVLGLDSRGTEGQLARTDAILLVGADPARLRLSVLSIPRDLFVEVPGYGSQRVNTVNLLGEQEASGGGPALLSSALNQTLDIRTDRFVRLDFQGFVALIDAVGGVVVDVERQIVDDAYPTADGGVTTVRFEAGVQQMAGEQALIYSRVRHGGDDYQRAARQQQVLSALLRRLVNPLRWPAVAAALGQSVETDLSLLDLASIAPLVILNAGRYDMLVIDRDFILGTAEGHAVPDLERLGPWLDGRFD